MGFILDLHELSANFSLTCVWLILTPLVTRVSGVMNFVMTRDKGSFQQILLINVPQRLYFSSELNQKLICRLWAWYATACICYLVPSNFDCSNLLVKIRHVCRETKPWILLLYCFNSYYSMPVYKPYFFCQHIPHWKHAIYTHVNAVPHFKILQAFPHGRRPSDLSKWH